MSNALTFEGSPLDDYFSDNEEDTTATSTSLHQDLDRGASLVSDLGHHDAAPCVLDNRFNSSEGEDGETTLVNMMTDPDPDLPKHTDHPDHPSYHHHPAPTLPTPLSTALESAFTYSPPGRYPLARQLRSAPQRTLSDDGFAERFKYAIISSGVLEKNHVPGIGRDMDEVEELVSVEQRDDLPLGSEDSRDLHATLESDLRTKLLAVRSIALERWDISAAVLAIVCGLALMMGTWAFVTLMTSLCGSLPIATVYLGPSKKIGLTEAPNVSPQSSLKTSASVDPRAASLLSLTSLLTVSRDLDSSIERSLSLLQPHRSHPDGLYALRLALHRLTGNMTDHLATATSTSLSMVDKKELAVLGEMYDIPTTGNLFYTRRPSQGLDANSDEEDTNASAPRAFASSVPSPRKTSPLIGHAYAHNPPPLFTGLTGPVSMSTSQSLPEQHRARHLSLAKTPTYYKTIPPYPFPHSAPSDDRFTSLPIRKPRTSKRASWDSEVWAIARNEGLTMALAPAPYIPTTRGMSRPKHERRITEADEGDGDGEGGEGKSVIEGDQSSSGDFHTRPRSAEPVLRGSLLTSPNLRNSPFTPKRASPLAAYRTSAISISQSSPGGHSSIPSPSPIHPVNLNLNSFTPNPKRRSLQNMPYYPSSDDGETTKDANGLTRTRSMPFSDIQELRSRYATGSGSRSRRNSLLPPVSVDPTLFAILPTRSDNIQSVLSSPNSAWSPRQQQPSLLSTRMKRMESVSPLTFPALRASCLGIHLRRRRLGCCLLGLRFDEADPSYWDEVCGMMDELRNDVENERVHLEEAISDAKGYVDADERKKKEAEAKAQEEELPAWTRISNRNRHDDAGGVDFAPKSTDQVILLERIEEMQKLLDRAWRNLQLAKRSLPDQAQLEENWGSIRKDLGLMVRDWERGKEVISRSSVSAIRADSSNREDRSDLKVNTNDLPAFVKSWSADTDDSASTSFETDHAPPGPDSQVEQGSRGDDLHGLDVEMDMGMTEKLPPPGRDAVFEADTISALPDRGKSIMSREERIRLVKEARDTGMSLGQLLALGKNNEDEDESLLNHGARDEKEAKARGGMVVDELKGMIGMIRRRKGVVEESDGHDNDHTGAQRGQEGLNEAMQEQGRGKENINDINGDDGIQVSRVDMRQIRKQMEEALSSRNIKNGDEGEDDLDWRRGFVFPALENQMDDTLSA